MKTAAVWRGTALLMALMLIKEVSVHDLDTDYTLWQYTIDSDLPKFVPYVVTGGTTDEEQIQQIRSFINAHRASISGRPMAETNSLVNTKYRTSKRNADVINALLALPKSMNDAGR